MAVPDLAAWIIQMAPTITAKPRDALGVKRTARRLRLNGLVVMRWLLQTRWRMNHKVTCCFDNRLVLATWHASRKVLFMSRLPLAGTAPKSNSLSASAELDKGIKRTIEQESIYGSARFSVVSQKN